VKLQLRIAEERWALLEPFEIAGQVMDDVATIHVALQHPDGTVGQAEAAGVDYDGETPASMREQLLAVAPRLTPSTTAADIATWLPRGGARNALDCAWWDLQAKRSGTPAWSLAGLQPMRPLCTACTIGLGSPEDTQRRARSLAGSPLVKVKVDATRHVSSVRAVREQAPEARLMVDANQSWTRALLEELLPELLALGVELIEQPVARGRDAELDGLVSPIPIVADESCTDRHSLPALVHRYQGVNIKLDKSGGLTEALELAREARSLGLEVMVGNMCGSSLAMAPAFLVAQLARWADLDGPMLQKQDRSHAMRCVDGFIEPPNPRLWG
jgi:L-alanine-DL-glutamate epimerase-like enolase superfamily enzyme